MSDSEDAFDENDATDEMEEGQKEGDTYSAVAVDTIERYPTNTKQPPTESSR